MALKLRGDYILSTQNKSQGSKEIQSTMIFIATHKDYTFPVDKGYTPLHVGRSLSTKDLLFKGDDTGDNISCLNYNFCELTALYWMWKNKSNDADFLGLVHYRRYFKPTNQSIRIMEQSIASSFDLQDIMRHCQIVLPKPRNYWIETIEQHYNNAHYANDLRIVKKTLLRKYPEYWQAFDNIFRGRKLSLYNMFVMKKEHLDAYCSWLFDILFEVEKTIQYKNYGPYQRRVFGFLGERLLNVWVTHNFKPHEIKYLPIINLEGENLILKAIGLLKRKFKGEKLK